MQWAILQLTAEKLWIISPCAIFPKVLEQSSYSWENNKSAKLPVCHVNESIIQINYSTVRMYILKQKILHNTSEGIDRFEE